MLALILVAHADDETLGVGGTILKLKKKGWDVNIVALSDGKLTVRGKKQDNRKSFNNACKFLGVKKFTLLNFKDQKFDTVPIADLANKVAQLGFKPDLIITHSQNDYHTDHRSLSMLVCGAVSHYIPVLFCDTLMGINFNPNYYVDITDYYQLKKKAILMHKTQNPERFVDLFKLMNSYRAAQCNAPRGMYAEAYNFIPSFPFADIRGLLPQALELRPFHIDDHNGFL